MEGTKNVLSQNSQTLPNKENCTLDSNVKQTKNTQTGISVAYIWNDTYRMSCDRLPKVPLRASLTHSLIESYGLLNNTRIISARPARVEELQLFHSAEYIDCLRRVSEAEDWEQHVEEADQHGLTYDCPPFPGVYEYASYVAGASVKAAQCLMMGIADVAINWPGGWHHSKRDEASGFCFLNDIVVAILTLRKKYERVLYVDIDLHHGDGVEDAFCATSKVFTVSFHKVSPGFFPGSGRITDTGVGRGKGYQLNVPIKDGAKDDVYIDVFTRVLSEVKEKYDPQVIVCQCGADGLYGDPMSSYNLTPRSLCACVKYLQGWKLPLMLLGGGGYHLANTARCWTQITATVMGRTLPSDIPEHKYFTKYGPDYSIDIEPGNRKDFNSPDYIESLVSAIKENLSKIHCAS